MSIQNNNARNGATEPEKVLTPEMVASILQQHDEICQTHRICYYPSVDALVEQVRSSRHWAMGEIFVYVESATRYIVMKQIAPSSCEMLTITHAGYADVLTAYRFEQQELVATLEGYLEHGKS